METTIQKWGNSQGLRIAKDILKQAGLKTGAHVQVSVQSDNIIIRKVHKPNHPTLDELLAKIPKG